MELMKLLYDKSWPMPGQYGSPFSGHKAGKTAMMINILYAWKWLMERRRTPFRDN